MAQKKLEAKFTKERETKNKVRFEEEGDAPIIDKLYVGKSHLEKIGNPDSLKVVIEVG